MFQRLLIANRGEIACRIQRTAQRLGIETVAVYSAADRHALHVQQADWALPIGPAEARQSYLNIDTIMHAAESSGADALHPGYGFLSENAALAERCQAAGIRFVGPSATAIAAMGDKRTAKVLMAAAGVPMLPGYHGEDQDPERLRAAAADCGYPVLLKACAGGGGKGMRIVAAETAFNTQLAAVQREARAAFGDERVLIERYLPQPRHIEVQIFADTHGNLVHLFERDCSMQRRYQKVIEETPACGLSEAARSALCETALQVARSIDYCGAGTVEFICDRDGQGYFMEMNTRLQVEHPISEQISGQDLVEWQLRVAAGEPLPLRQAQIQCSGHAIEARLYAEDPGRDFLPTSGTIAQLYVPPNGRLAQALSEPAWPERAPNSAELGGQTVTLRIDSGVQAGDTIGIDYDPMIAKLIVHADSREAARAALARALRQTQIVGLGNNIDFLQRLVDHPCFRQGDYHTGSITEHATHWRERPAAARDALLALAAVYLHSDHPIDTTQARGAEADSAPGKPRQDPWQLNDRWRLNLNASATSSLSLDGRRYGLQISSRGQHFTIASGPVEEGSEARSEQPVERRYCRTVKDAQGQVSTLLTLIINGRCIQARIVERTMQLYIFSTLGQGIVERAATMDSTGEEQSRQHQLRAPMPGKIIALSVSPGEHVQRGQSLMILEAMKMEHALCAPDDCQVGALHCQLGDTIAADALLLELQPPA